jgi:hypothetical protein
MFKVILLLNWCIFQLENNRRSGSGSIAHIAPRVGGMEIRKPTICLTKMSVAELSNMAIALRDPDTVNPIIDQPEAQDGVEIPFIDEDGDFHDEEVKFHFCLKHMCLNESFYLW